MKISIFDLDGTISDDRHRRHFLKKEQYAAYHAKMPDDEKMNIDLLEAACAKGNFILFITGRPEERRKETVRWLPDFFAQYSDWRVLMRPEGNLKASPELKVDLLVNWLEDYGHDIKLVTEVYDDDIQILNAYKNLGISADKLFHVSGPGLIRNFSENKLMKNKKLSAVDILREMALLYDERNVLYKDNYKRIPKLMKVLFPAGIPIDLLHDTRWHLFSMIVAKLGRFATTDLTHKDSIKDIAVYAAMILEQMED